MGDAWTSALDTQTLPCYNPTEVTSKNPNIQCFEQLSFIDFAGNYQLRFPVGLGTTGHDLIPNADGKDAWTYNASVGHKTRDPTVPENEGGKLCKCRFHKGLSPNDDLCKGEVDPTNGQTLITPFNQAKAARIDEPLFSLGTVATGNADTDMKTCTPWSDAYGFFFGDGTFKNDGLVFDVTEVVHGSGLLENMVRLRSQKFSHVYSAATTTEGGAWTAFWTGGNKANTIENNKLGRFRLEVGVRFDGGVGNASPVITAPPVIPVLYQDGGAKFTIPAHDPNSGDTVAFFLGDQDEQGGLLGNEDLSGNLTYHFNMYLFRACQSSRAPEGTCRQRQSSGLDFASASAYTRVTDPAEQLPDWNENVNLPHQPPQLSVDALTGVVTWRTGKDPWTADTDGSRPVKPGFYNLVVMVEERKPSQRGDARRGTGMKVPVDLLLYLHPPASFCSLDCDNSNSGSMLTTSETSDGLYGHPSSGGVYPLGGTGSCKVCGGGGARLSLTNRRVPSYEDAINYERYAGGQSNGTRFCNVRQFSTGGPNGDPLQPPNTESCCNNGMTTDALEYGKVSDPSFVRPMPSGYNFSGCLGAAYPSQVPLTVVPYTGVFSPCKKNTAPIFLTSDTSPAGATMPMTPQTLELNGTTVAMPPLARKTFTLGADVSYTLDAYDADNCNELSIKAADLRRGMSLSTHSRVTKNRVTRRLEWKPFRTLANGTRVYTDDPELDERERVTVTCFYASDGYEQTSHPPHCVEVTLLFPARISWCDSTPPSGTVLEAHFGEEVSVDLCVEKGKGVAAAVDIRVVTEDIPGSIPYDATLRIYGETNTTSPPTLPAFPPAPQMPNITNCTADGAAVAVTLVHGPGMNATTCTNATNASSLIEAALAPPPGHDFNVTHYMRWTNPTTPFAPPYDSINFPEGAALDPPNAFPFQDPFTRRFRFTPREGQECVFTVCFEGYDASTSPGTPDNPEEFTVDKRCYKIEVHNSLLRFNGLGSASHPNLSAAMPTGEGLAATAWVKPDCDLSGGGNVTVLAFGSIRDEGNVTGISGVTPDVGLSLRNSIGWTPGRTPSHPGVFYYADCRSGYAASAVGQLKKT